MQVFVPPPADFRQASRRLRRFLKPQTQQPKKPKTSKGSSHRAQDSGLIFANIVAYEWPLALRGQVSEVGSPSQRRRDSGWSRPASTSLQPNIPCNESNRSLLEIGAKPFIYTPRHPSRNRHALNKSPNMPPPTPSRRRPWRWRWCV